MKRRTEPTPQMDSAVPPEIAVGSCVEIWSESGHPHDLGTAFGRYGMARRAWEVVANLDVATSCALVPPSSPYSVTTPQGLQRLAARGYSPEDVTWLRIAAQQRANDTDPTNRRSTP